MTSFFAKLFGRRSGLHLLGDPARGDDGEQRAHAMAADLLATRADKRLAAAINAGLPQSALALKEHAGTLLGAMIDDDELRPTLGLAAFHAWLAHDRDAAMAFAIARAPLLPALMLWQVLMEIADASEIYDVLAPIHRSRSVTQARGFLEVPFPDATVRRVLGDPRFVDLALEGMAKDVRVSCTLLGLNGSARAVDELRAVLERVPDAHEPSGSTDDDAVAAIDGLAAALPEQLLIDELASFLSSQPERLVPHMYLSMRIAPYSSALDRHPLIRANASLRWAVAQSAMPPPMPVG